MSLTRGRCVPLALAAHMIAPGSLAPATDALPPGVVVVEVRPGGAAARAGLEPGDVLLSWERPAAPPGSPEPAAAELRSPFDLLEVELEQAPRAMVTLRGGRASVSLDFALPAGRWDLLTRPQLRAVDLERFLAARRRVEGVDAVQGFADWRAMAADWGTVAHDESAAWLHYVRGKAAQDRRQWDEAARALQDAVEQAPAAPDARLAAHLQSALAEVYAAQSDLDRAQTALLDALAIRERLQPDSLAVAASRSGLGVLARTRGDPAAGEGFHRSALAIRERLAPGSLQVAESLANLGGLAWDRDDLAAAEDAYRRALAIREALAPGSLEVASSLNNLGSLASKRGDLAAAEDSFRKALAIRQRAAPGSLETASSLNNLGVLAWNRGDLAAAEDSFREALAVREAIAPGSADVAGSCNNLGVLAAARGDLAGAEDYHRKALAIYEQLVPGSLLVAASRNNLGQLAWHRGDLAAAEADFGRSLTIRQHLAPGSLDVAASLNNLGGVAHHRGDLAAAEEHFRRALAIREQLAPGSLDHAASLNNLGALAYRRGDLAAAAESYRQALAIQEQLARDSLPAAMSLFNLGETARAGGDRAAAEACFRKALAIQERFALGSLVAAQCLHQLGTLAFSSGDRQGAAAWLRRAIDTLEAQAGRLGGGAEAKATFRAQHGEIYQDTLRVLIARYREAAPDAAVEGLPAEAFHVLERSRARGLLALLAERDLVFGGDLPAGLESERRGLQVAYDRTQAQLAELSPEEDAEQVEHLLRTLRDLRRRGEEVRDEVRRLSPRLAALQYPEPLDLERARLALDPGTVALAYSAGKEETYLFVLTAAGPLRVETLPVGEERLREEVARVRCLLEHPGSLRGLAREAPAPCGLPLAAATPEAAAAALWAQAESLYRQLLGAVEPELAAAERLLILPDGPLHRLPFAALVRHPEGQPRQYLVEWKPVHTVVSLTLYDQLRRGRPPSERPPATLAAFGDPVYPQAAAPAETDGADPDLRWVRAHGRRLEPLPASRVEVEAIARLFGAEPWIGAQATEERAKAVPRQTRYLHFAVHGLLDERSPLDSALALTLPDKPQEGQDNGLLQAWEIFERLRVDAELVTLSACETGLGQELGGEGLIGLTRAFQYAGARSVVASLWNVNDPATAALMQRFYGYLRQGRSKDEALRAAQIDLLRGPVAVPGAGGRPSPLDTSHPFYWSAFQLSGDWR